MYLEKVLPQINDAVSEIESMLKQTMPDALRAGLEGEHRRLLAAQLALAGEGKSLLHELRAKLRWARKSAEKEKDPAKKKAFEKELKNLEGQIEREASLRKS